MAFLLETASTSVKHRSTSYGNCGLRHDCGHKTEHETREWKILHNGGYIRGLEL